VDFDCPQGKPWIVDPVVKVELLGLSEASAIRLIDQAADEGVWHDLKEILRVTRAAVELKSGESSCWKHKQFRRVRDMLTAAKRKGLVNINGGVKEAVAELTA
jgi:hypothetical protein